MSYKGDAIELLATAIDKENQAVTPAGKELEVDASQVAEVQNNVDVEVNTSSVDVADSTDSADSSDSTE